MTLTVEATYENGVFVPAQKPTLADHQRVRLTVESVGSAPAGVEPARRRRDRRIVLESNLAQEIAESPEFNPDGN
jgi:predicted DNA-binding antitoxin AbrB/MazE fold protein